MKSINRILQLIFGAAGLAISLAGALLVGAEQLSFTGSTIWPLPGLVLLDWAGLGVAGFLGLLSEGNPKAPYYLNIIWFVIGAQMPLVVLGAFSIGAMVLLSLIAFLVAALLASAQIPVGWLGYGKYLLVGMLANLVVLLLLISFGRGFI